MSTRIPVIFRMDPAREGQCFALFPTLPGAPVHNCTCYQHIGQHSSADYHGCIRASRPAKPAEWKALARELRGIGYRFKIHRKATQKMHEACRKAHTLPGKPIPGF